jgi:hypothetical protein
VPDNITMALRIERSVRQGITVLTLSGHMKAEEVAKLKALFDADYRTIVLDLQDVRLADRDAVKFLRDCEADGMKLENCPAYVREWMEREKNLREPAIDSSGSRDEVYRSDEYIFFGTERCRSSEAIFERGARSS